jgi:hypothetical protein
VGIKEPDWMRAMFAISGVLTIPLFVILMFKMQTKYRKELLENDQYLDLIKEKLENHKPENLPAPPVGASEIEANPDELEKRRKERYKKNQLLFLVHNWLPSRTKSQVADIVISIFEHGDGEYGGALSKGEIKSVEYYLGPKFFGVNKIVKTNAKDKFSLYVSAYGPVLCLAKVNLSDGQSIILERYIDFFKTASKQQ